MKGKWKKKAVERVCVCLFAVMGLWTAGVTVSAGEPEETDWRKTGVIEEPVIINEDTKVEGDLHIISGGLGALTIDSHTLTVTGNVYVGNRADVDIGSGELHVGGNFVLEPEDAYGCMRMMSKDSVLRVDGNFVATSSGGYNELKMGTIYIGGDFLQLGEDGHFNASGTNKVIFNGSGKQTVCFEAVKYPSPYLNAFNEISVPEGYSGQLHVKTSLNFKSLGSDLTLISDAAEDGSYASLGYGGVVTGLRGHTLKVKNGVRLVGNMDLEGGELSVDGDFVQVGGEGGGALLLNKGKLFVAKDWYTENEGNSVYVEMVHAEDEIRVAGSYTSLTGAAGSSNKFTAGTMYVGGDFTALGHGFRAGDTHKVVLNGSGTQTVRFEAESDGGNGFQEVCVPEDYEGEIHVKESIKFKALGCDLTLISDAAEDGSYASLGYSGAAMGLCGHTLKVKNGIRLVGNMNLEGGELSVDGDFVQVGEKGGGALLLGKGKLSVAKDWYPENESNSVYVEMVNEEDEIRVAGSYTALTGAAGSSNKFTAGTMYVGGDFIANASFRPGEGHTVILDGENPQKVTLDSSAGFYRLGITKNKETGYRFSREECWKELFCAKHSGGTATCSSKAVCDVLGEEYGEMDKDNHTGGTEVRGEKPATVTEKGYTGDTYCKACGAILKAGEEIPMLQKTDISGAAVSGMEDRSYTGTPVEQEGISVTLSGAVLKAGADYTVAYENNTEIGTAKVVITGTGSYTGSITKTFEVTVKKGAEYTVDFLRYQITGEKTDGSGTVTLVGSEKKDGISTLSVKDSVTIGGKSFKVTAVGSKAFSGCKKLKTVRIGKNVTVIDAQAFSGCTKLNSLTLGTGLTEIGSKAFYKCSALKKLTVPAKVAKIGSSAFSDCKSLKNLTMKPSKVPTFGKNAFKGIKSAAEIKVPGKQYNIYKKKLTSKTGVKKTMKLKK